MSGAPQITDASGVMKVKVFVTVTVTASPACNDEPVVRSWHDGEAAGVTATRRSAPSRCTREVMLFGSVHKAPVAC